MPLFSENGLNALFASGLFDIDGDGPLHVMAGACVSRGGAKPKLGYGIVLYHPASGQIHEP